jgi:hypothetical protein
MQAVGGLNVMNKRTSRTFSIFWLVAGLAWVAATIRHEIVNDDAVGTIIYIVAAIASFILAFLYYRNLAKQ